MVHTPSIGSNSWGPGWTFCLCPWQDYVHFGGYEQLADCFSNDIHKLDTSTMTWTLVCTKGNPARWRDFHSATMLGSHMYVFGGRADRFGPFHSNNEIYCNRIRVFDTRTEAWLDCPPRQCCLRGAGATQPLATMGSCTSLVAIMQD